MTAYGPPALPQQVRVIAWRSIRRALRQPAVLVPPMVFPLVLLAINSAGLADAPAIPGFPADSYLDFALVVTFMQGALFATTTAGLSLGRDIEQGFLERLALTPMSGVALVAGQLAGAVVMGLMSACLYVLVGWLFGVQFESGPAGVVLLIALAAVTSLAFAAIGAYMALRAGTGEAVQGLFPVLFATLFLSTLTMPLDLIEADWFRAIATWNPVSSLIDGMRSLVISGWDLELLLRDAAVLAAALALGLWGCSVALRQRLTRT